MASFINTVKAPPSPRSSAVTGSPFIELATTMLPVEIQKRTKESKMRKAMNISFEKKTNSKIKGITQSLSHVS
jgi:hypothetical protein